MPEVVPEDTHGQMPTRSLFALERGAVPEVLRKWARVWTGIVWELPDLLSTPRLDRLCQHGELSRDI
jgi:hypothetical protein